MPSFPGKAVFSACPYGTHAGYPVHVYACVYIYIHIVDSILQTTGSLVRASGKVTDVQTISRAEKLCYCRQRICTICVGASLNTHDVPQMWSCKNFDILGQYHSILHQHAYRRDLQKV